MVRKKRYLVLGFFGYKNNQLDGQTIKTRNIYELLNKHAKNDVCINFFDTQNFKSSSLSVLSMFWKIIKSDKIIYLPAHKNLKYLFPIIFLLSKIFKNEIIYIVVGGWLNEYLKNKKFHVLFLSKIKAILTENGHLTESLKSNFNFRNVLTFPNFRIHSFEPKLFIDHGDFRIVFMARIMRMKGLEYIFYLSEQIKKWTIKKPIIIDIYGPVEKEDKDFFFNYIQKCENVFYRGLLKPDEIYETLNKYDLMIFPTRFYTEGFPGTVLDAYISGLPIVATSWKYAADFIVHEQTGLIVPFEESKDLFVDAVLRLYHNPEQLKEMKTNALKESKKYSSDHAWRILIQNKIV